MIYRFFQNTLLILHLSRHKLTGIWNWNSGQLLLFYRLSSQRCLIVSSKKRNQLMPKAIFFAKFNSDRNHNMPKKSKKKEDKGLQVTEQKSTPLKTPIDTDPDKNVLIRVYAKPGAKQNTITDISEEGINIQINAPPVEGAANTELVKYMASFLDLKSSSVSLERGHRSRNKVLKISGNITRIEIVKKINAELPAKSKLPEDD